MTRSFRRQRASLLVLGFVAVAALVAVIALPAFAASPQPSAGDQPGKGSKASEPPAVAVTLRGLVSATTAADGGTSYTLAAGGATLRLEVGPPWFSASGSLLAPFVGKTVTIVGERSGDELEVETVDGVAIRAAGRPPWAGGWKAVGSAHPGWSQDKADRWAQRHQGALQPGAGGCWPPGHCKSAEPAESGQPSGG